MICKTASTIQVLVMTSWICAIHQIDLCSHTIFSVPGCAATLINKRAAHEETLDFPHSGPDSEVPIPLITHVVLLTSPAPPRPASRCPDTTRPLSSMFWDKVSGDKRPVHPPDSSKAETGACLRRLRTAGPGRGAGGLPVVPRSQRRSQRPPPRGRQPGPLNLLNTSRRTGDDERSAGGGAPLVALFLS